jgi:ankyrin repeat protein
MPLHAAASSANPAVIRLLVAKGADVNVRTKAPGEGHGVHGDVAGATPLAIVARARQIAGAATLCALGADPEFERWPVQYGWWLTRREGLLRKLGVRI